MACRAPVAEWRRGDGTSFRFPPAGSAGGACQPRGARSSLHPPASGAGPASPAPFSPAPRRRSATRAPQGGQEAGAPAARPAARKMVTSAGQLALLALGMYATCCALPAATPRLPWPLLVSFLGRFWESGKRLMLLMGRSLGGDGERLRVTKRGAVEREGAAAPGTRVRAGLNFNPPGSVCSHALPTPTCSPGSPEPVFAGVGAVRRRAAS